MGVPRCPEDGGAVVIHQGEGNAAKINAHVEAGQGQHIFRGVHPAQEGGRIPNTYHRQKYAAHQRHQKRRVNRAVNHLVLPAANGVRYAHACSHRQADEQIDNQIGNGTGNTHRRHGDAAAKATNHHQVRRIEQQLQIAGQDNGDGIAENAPSQRAFQHIPFRFLHVLNALLLFIVCIDYTSIYSQCQNVFFTVFSAETSIHFV